MESGSAFSHQTATTYNASGRPESIDPPGYGTDDRTSLAYDPSRGGLLLASRTEPLIGTTLFGYDAFNRRTRVTDVNGVVVETTYDAFDRTTSITHKGTVAAEDLVTTLVFNPFGDLFRTILPEGNVIEYDYDHVGRLISMERRPDVATRGERMFYALDAAGNRSREQKQRWDGTGWVTESFTDFEYSDRCYLAKIVYADGTANEYGYDCEGNIDRVWDANHPSEGQTRPPTHVFTYDELERLETASQPWTGTGGGIATTTYTYDAQDHLVKVTDANGGQSSYVYSDRDLLTEELSEVSGRTTFRYNEHGRRIETTDARGVTISQQVDAFGRVRLVDYPGTSLDVTYRFDEASVPFAQGRLTAIERAGATVDYGYDRFGRRTRDGELSHTYDRNGNRLTVGYPGGLTARYSYDFADRQATLALEGAGAASGPLVTAAQYLPAGPLSRLELGNGLTEVRDFDGRYVAERIAVGSVFDWRYATDDLGNVQAITDGIDPAGSRSYSYQDISYFLTGGDGPWGSSSWIYDKVGNRLSETRGGTTATYSYVPNAAGGSTSKLAAVNTPGELASYFYDAAGELTHVAGSAGKTRYTYDAAQRLARMAHDAEDEPSAATDLLYDGRNFLQRSTLRRSTGAQPGVETTATYSSGGLLHYRTQTTRRTRPRCGQQPPPRRPWPSSTSPVDRWRRSRSARVVRKPSHT